MSLLNYPRTLKDTCRPASHLSPFTQGQILWLYFLQSFPILSCTPMPHLGLGSLPCVLSLLLGVVSLQFSHPFSVFRFLLCSSVDCVMIELKSGNTWTNCMLPESLTRTTQGCLFFWLIFPFVWFCFVFKSFFCCDSSLILVLWSFSRLTQFFISLGVSPLCLPSLDIAGKAIFSERPFTPWLGKRKVVAHRYYFKNSHYNINKYSLIGVGLKKTLYTWLTTSASRKKSIWTLL